MAYPIQLRPIRTEEDHRAALEEIERLWDAEAGSPDEDLLDVLTTLVEAYEARHHPIAPPDPIEAVRYFMESRGLSRQDLEEFIGGRGRVTEVLNRKRSLTLGMIRRLNSHLGIPADVLIQPYPVPKSRSLKRPTSKPSNTSKPLQ